MRMVTVEKGASGVSSVVGHSNMRTGCAFPELFYSPVSSPSLRPAMFSAD